MSIIKSPNAVQEGFRLKKYNINGIVLLLIGFYLILPLAVTLIYSLSTEWMEVLPRGLTAKYYAELVSDSLFWQAIVRSVIISFIPVVLTAAALLLVMYAVTVYLPAFDKYLQILCTIPYAIQGVILPVSVLSLYSVSAWPFSNRIIMLIFTYSVIILPYMYQGIKNSLITVEATKLLEAAQMLGADRFYAFFHIIVPCMLSGVVISSMLSVAIIFGDFVIVNTIGGSYYYTAQMYLLKKMFISGQLTSAVIIILFTVTLVISAVMFYFKSKTAMNSSEEN